jgi:hypothetical protein
MVEDITQITILSHFNILLRKLTYLLRILYCILNTDIVNSCIYMTIKLD